MVFFTCPRTRNRSLWRGHWVYQHAAHEQPQRWPIRGESRADVGDQYRSAADWMLWKSRMDRWGAFLTMAPITNQSNTRVWKSGELVHRTFANRWPHESASRESRRLARRNQDFAAAVTCASGGVLTIEPSKSGPPSARRAGRWIHSAYDPPEKPEPGLRPMPQPVNRGNGRRAGGGVALPCRGPSKHTGV